jgi:hypothetical protein
LLLLQAGQLLVVLHRLQQDAPPAPHGDTHHTIASLARFQQNQDDDDDCWMQQMMLWDDSCLPASQPSLAPGHPINHNHDIKVSQIPLPTP